MSTTIDQKVVEMRFDNKQFESNVSDTMTSLNKLQDSLNMTGATKGLENVNSAVKNCNVSGLSGAVEAVQAKFSALEVVAVTALANITNSAVNYGKKIVSALTIDPIKTGFSEYETQINAIQTILANTESKGKTLDDVNSALDELNTYADKTIYNFTEMTRNIGTFTAAGVDLDTSVSAIKGIANLAAVSGSTSQQASTAMYQLSQAMASGTVKLMDWNSVVNAGMGGQVFQDALKETAKVHGVAIDDIIKKQGSFRESLSEGWLTTEILTDTLAKFTGDLSKEQLKAQGYTDEQIEGIMKLGKTANDAATKVKTFTQLFDTLKESAQSGWTQTWEILVGDFEEAKELLTQVSDTIGAMIGKSAEARNEMLSDWKALGGRTDLIESIRNVFEGIMSVVTPIKEAFRDIFPPMTGEQLAGFTEGLKSLTEKLTLSDTASENLRRTFRGLFAVIDIVRQIFVAVVKAVASLFSGVDKLGGGILGVTGSFGDMLVRLNEMIKRSDIFNKVFQGIASIIKVLLTSFGSFIGLLKEHIVAPGLNLIQDILSRMGDKMGGIGGIAEKMRAGVVKAIEAIGKAFENCSVIKVLDAVWNVLKIIGGIVGKVFGSIAKGLGDALSGASFENVIQFMNTLITGGLGVALIKFIKNLSSPIDALKEGIENIAGVFKGITGIFDDVRGALQAWQTNLKADTLMKIAGAVGILVAAIVVLSVIDGEKLASALGTITALFAELMTSMAIFSRISGSFGGVQKACTSMISISISILILASAVKKLSDMGWGELTKGLTGVAALLTMVVAATKILGSGNQSNIVKGAGQMVLFAAAIKILASACKSLSELSWSAMAKGLTGVGILLAEVSLFINNTKFSGKAITTATGIVILAAAVKVLASACKDFAQMDVNEMTKGLGAIAIVLAELAIFTNLTGNAKHVLSTGVSLIAIAAAMKIFASAIGDMAAMSWVDLGKGLLGMAGALAAVTLALNLMPKDMALKGVGLIAVSTAIVILSTALNSMGGMSWEEIGKGLLTLGGALAILAVGLYAMSGTLAGSAALLIAATSVALLTPSLLMLGGMSWESVGKGLLTLAGAFTILGVAGMLLAPVTPVILALGAAVALVGVGVLAAGVGLLAFSAGLSALVTVASVGVVAITTAITNLCLGIVNAVPAIAEAAFAIIIAICDGLTKAVPSLMACIRTVLDALINLLVTYIPKLVDAGMKIILGVLKGIESHIGDITESALTIIANFIDGIAAGLPKVINSAMNLVIKFINGLADGIRSNTPKMIAAVDNLMDAVMDAIKAWFSHGLTNGKNLVNKVIDGVKGGFSGIKEAGKNLVTGFIDGVKSKFKKVADIAAELGKKALGSIKKVLGIKSPSREMIKVGKYTDEGFVKGLKVYAGKVINAAKGVGKSALTSMSNAISGIADIINGNVDSQPVIRPVMDLSDVRSGASALGSMLAFDSSVGMSANLGAISASMSGRNQNGGANDVVSAINKLRKDINSMDRTTYNIDGVTYDDGSNIAGAVKSIIRAARIERRV